MPTASEAFASVAALHRYPVKGLSPERLDLVELTAGTYFPGDRLYAIENGPSGFDPASPQHEPKIKYLMLMRNERLAALETRYDDATRTLVIQQDGAEEARGDLSTEAGRAEIESFFQRFVRYELRGAPRVLDGGGSFRFVDSPKGYVSLINLASVRAIQDLVGVPVDPLRFRGNLHLEGLEAWDEFDLVGHTIAIGNTARLRIIKRIERCAATNVEPGTGKRNLEIPKLLMREFGHIDCGVYAEIVEGGLVAEGDPIRLIF
ncbi:MOSC domain-containing protein [Ancylobacter terrae]|uniref:MOSC domain-containing protein n=1 Tax=Ancylobacter sp. sgz301288 TaxID=3342077 RepID=UPI00385C049A